MTGRHHPTRVYIVEDSLTIRALLETLIGLNDGFEICGAARLAETALAELDSSRPDIVLLDLMLPGLDGISFLRLVRQHWRAFDVVVISSSTKSNCFTSYQCLRFGAVACFDKSKIIKNGGEFITMLEAVATGADVGLLCDNTAVTLLRPSLPAPLPMPFDEHVGIAPLARPAAPV